MCRCQSRGLSLKVLEDREDISLWYRWQAKFVLPPIAKLWVNYHEVWFLGRWRLCKGVTDVASKSDIVEAGYDGPGQSVSGLFDASSICFCKRDNFSVSGASIASASGFFNFFEGDGVDFV